MIFCIIYIMEEEYVLRYTESDGLTIAYQIWGSSEDTLVYVPGMISHLEAGLEAVSYTHLTLPTMIGV